MPRQYNPMYFSLQRHFSAAQQPQFQVKVTKNPITTDMQALESVLPSKEVKEPELFFPQVVKDAIQPNPTWKAHKLSVSYSVHKLNAAAFFVRGKHIYDALTLINNVAKKGGPLIKSVLEAARHNGVKQGYSEERMWVKEVILGKKLGPKKIDIKARGKFGMMHSPISHITVIMEQKSAADFYKMVVSGNTPPTVGHVFRKMLYQNDADFERVKALSHMTTSQGRYYRRTQFKRMVQLIQKEYQSQGVQMKTSKIERNVLEKAAAEFLDMRRGNDEGRMLTNRTSRLAHFEKNYKKK